MQFLHDTSNIVLNMFAKLALSPVKGNSRIQYWQGRGSSRVELFASERRQSKLPVPIGVRLDSSSDHVSSVISAERGTACEKPLLEELPTLGADSGSNLPKDTTVGSGYSTKVAGLLPK